MMALQELLFKAFTMLNDLSVFLCEQYGGEKITVELIGQNSKPDEDEDEEKFDEEYVYEENSNPYKILQDVIYELSEQFNQCSENDLKVNFLEIHAHFKPDESDTNITHRITFDKDIEF
jgi:hypothetical protein